MCENLSDFPAIPLEESSLSQNSHSTAATKFINFISVPKETNVVEMLPKGDLSVAVGGPSLTLHLISGVVTLIVLLKFLQQIIGGPKQSKEFWSVLNRIPGPKPVWFVGNAHQLWKSTNRLSVMKSWCSSYGPYFKFRIGSRNIVVLNSPPVIQKLLSSTEPGHLDKGISYEIFRPFWKDGLVLSEPYKWKERRRFIAKAFTLRAFLGYMQVYNKESKNLIQTLTTVFREQQLATNNWQKDGVRKGIPLDEILWKATLRVICGTVMGTDIWGVDGSEELTNTMNKFKDILMWRALRPWLAIDWIWKWHPKSGEFTAGANDLTQFTENVIEIRKMQMSLNLDQEKDDEIDEENYVPGTKRHFKSMLEEMIKAGFDNDALTEEVNTLITTGYETSASTLQFLLILLAQNPSHQKLCQEEVDRVFEDSSIGTDGDIGYDDLPKFKHLEKCIYETLRHFPVAFFYSRTLKSPLKIENDVELPPGVDVAIVTTGIHHNPEIYPDPHIFNPDRFNAAETKARHQYAFIPFSAGARNCIGYKFGLIEVKILAARILHHFWVESTDKIEEMLLLPDTVLTPERGYNFILTPRRT